MDLRLRLGLEFERVHPSEAFRVQIAGMALQMGNHSPAQMVHEKARDFHSPAQILHEYSQVLLSPAQTLLEKCLQALLSDPLAEWRDVGMKKKKVWVRLPHLQKAFPWGHSPAQTIPWFLLLYQTCLAPKTGTGDFAYGLEVGETLKCRSFVCAMAQAPAEICGLWLFDGEVQHSDPVVVHDYVFDEQKEDCPAGHPLPAAQKTSHSKLLGLSLSW